MALVNIVRSDEQQKMLRGLGATHVLNSRSDGFRSQLVDALDETGATIAFDAIGGGSLGSDILRAMEQAASRRMTEYSRYGSNTFKQLYIYGALDLAPTVLNRLTLGFSMERFRMAAFPFLQKAGGEVAARLRQQVVDGLSSTFASHYTRTIGLAEALDPDVLRAYSGSQPVRNTSSIRRADKPRRRLCWHGRPNVAIPIPAGEGTEDRVTRAKVVEEGSQVIVASSVSRIFSRVYRRSQKLACRSVRVSSADSRADKIAFA